MVDIEKEMNEIVELIEKAKERLGGLSLALEEEDLSTDAVDEAMDALDDALDILGEELEG